MIFLDSHLLSIGPAVTLYAGSTWSPETLHSPALSAALRLWAREGVVLGALDTGVYLLAEAGLLNGKRATVYTSTRKGYVDECPNVGQLLKNLSFTLDMENTIMGSILDDKMEPEDAAKAWLKKNPQVLEPWLKDVATVDGRPGLEAVRGSL